MFPNGSPFYLSLHQPPVALTQPNPSSEVLSCWRLVRGKTGQEKEGGASFDGNKSKVTTISPFEYNSKPGDSAITYLQGIKGWDRPGAFLLVGANNSPGPTPLGFAYVGPLNSVANPAFNGSSGSGTWYPISVPTTFGAAGTSVYGPDKLAAGLVNYVGAYTRDLGGASPSSSNPSIVGFTYTGSVDGSTKGGVSQGSGPHIRGRGWHLHIRSFGGWRFGGWQYGPGRSG